MSRFDPATGQILVPLIRNSEELIFNSITTKINYPAEPEDTLRFTEDLKKTNITVSTRQLQNMIDDITNPRHLGFCPNCKKLAIIVSIQNGDEMETINGCMECKFKFPAS